MNFRNFVVLLVFLIGFGLIIFLQQKIKNRKKVLKERDFRTIKFFRQGGGSDVAVISKIDTLLVMFSIDMQYKIFSGDDWNGDFVHSIIFIYPSKGESGIFFIHQRELQTLRTFRGSRERNDNTVRCLVLSQNKK